MEKNKLVIKKLVKCYQNNIPILNDINLTVSLGEKISITGENGTGKSTLLRILATLIYPTSGEISFNGINYYLFEKSYRHLIGLMPSASLGLYSKLTGLENLRYFASLYHIDFKKLDILIEEWKECPIFVDALNKKFYLCSTGMKNILLLFKTFMHDPHFLLLDEPLSSFDNKTRQFALKKINSFSKNKFTIFTSHQGCDVLDLSDRTMVLKGGTFA